MQCCCELAAAKTGIARALLVGLTAALCDGCTVAELYQDGEVSSRSFGIGATQIPGCGTEGSHSEISTLGVGIGKDRALLGFHKSTRTCLPLDSCNAIFFIESPHEAAAVRDRFPDIAAACLIERRI